MAREAEETWGDLAIAIPTFRRNPSLIEVLESILRQSVRPGRILIIDNDAGSGAAPVAQAYADRLPLLYHSMGKNSGPAGAFHQAVRLLQSQPGSQIWMLCRGDDNPFSDPQALEGLRELATRTATREPGAIGFYGRPFFDFPNRPCGDDLVSVSHIPGGGMATYHIPRITAAGVNFNPDLFFGFEEMEMGLKIRSAGLPILVSKEEHHAYVSPPRRMAPWRTYFGHRNRLIVTRRFGRKRHVFLFLAMSAYGVARRFIVERNLAAAKAVILGAFDGLRSNTQLRPSYIPTPQSTDPDIE